VYRPYQPQVLGRVIDADTEIGNGGFPITFCFVRWDNGESNKERLCDLNNFEALVVVTENKAKRHREAFEAFEKRSKEWEAHE
jgi:hypothetical protein